MKATAAEIADALGISRQAVNKRAKKEAWPITRDKVRGGGNVYDLESLPLGNTDRIKISTALTKPAEVLMPETIFKQEEPIKQEPPPSTDAAKQRALFKADLLNLYNKALDAAPWGEKVKARDEFIAIYNSGIVWPNLLKEIGQVSWKTLETWNQKMKKHHNDCFFLVDQRGSHARGKCGLTDEQTAIFLRCVLRPNKPRIAESYRIAKAIMKHKGIENRHSEATYRRWALNWKSRNYDLWVWAREGAKAWNDKCAMYIERDMNLLQVGDVIVADGHNLNFEIINPWTGKPTNHMTLILFYDMRSNMPLGWEIMPTENTAAISSALRRAVLRLGKYPRVVYLDNGKAFKSRFFKGSEDFDTAGYGGLYKRMGCQTIYAWPYHGQSKTVERFFGTFGELERLSPTYTGNSIANKPPRMLRGEKKHRAIHEQQFGGRCLTLEEAHKVIASWFDEYAKRPQRGHLNGACPMDVFTEGKGPGIDRAELIWLMMQMEIKTIHRNGITFQGQNYYHPALVNRRHKVSIRYDLQDTSSIWVMDAEGALICEATPVEKVHPAAAQLGTEADKEQLRRHIEQKRNQEKQAASSAVTLLRNEILPEHRRQMEAIGMATALDKPKQKVISYDAEKIRREVEEMQRLQEEAKERDFRDSLMKLDEGDRYERLIELTAQGVELGPEWTGFMAFFEQTSAYTSFPEYWESCRVKYGLMWRAMGAAPTGA